MSNPQPIWDAEIGLYVLGGRMLPKLPKMEVKVIWGMLQEIPKDFPGRDEYIQTLERITKRAAEKNGWCEAEITCDIHNTTTNGTHKNGQKPIYTRCEAHITSKMKSLRPRMNATYHIHTKTSDARIPNPQTRGEMEKYPGGFPYNVLQFKGLSRMSERMPTPKQEYRRVYNEWSKKQTEQQHIADQETKARGEYLYVGKSLPGPHGTPGNPPSTFGSGNDSRLVSGSSRSGNSASGNMFDALGSPDSEDESE